MHESVGEKTPGIETSSRENCETQPPRGCLQAPLYTTGPHFRQKVPRTRTKGFFFVLAANENSLKVVTTFSSNLSATKARILEIKHSKKTR